MVSRGRNPNLLFYECALAEGRLGVQFHFHCAWFVCAHRLARPDRRFCPNPSQPGADAIQHAPCAFCCPDRALHFRLSPAPVYVYHRPDGRHHRGPHRDRVFVHISLGLDQFFFHGSPGPELSGFGKNVADFGGLFPANGTCADADGLQDLDAAATAGSGVAGLGRCGFVRHRHRRICHRPGRNLYPGTIFPDGPAHGHRPVHARRGHPGHRLEAGLPATGIFPAGSPCRSRWPSSPPR